jgi:hypothetical protein
MAYRASAKWVAFAGSCSSKRSIWFASEIQLLAMPSMIVSVLRMTSV